MQQVQHEFSNNLRTNILGGDVVTSVQILLMFQFPQHNIYKMHMIMLELHLFNLANDILYWMLQLLVED